MKLGLCKYTNDTYWSVLVYKFLYTVYDAHLLKPYKKSNIHRLFDLKEIRYKDKSIKIKNSFLVDISLFWGFSKDV